MIYVRCNLVKTSCQLFDEDTQNNITDDSISQLFDENNNLVFSQADILSEDQNCNMGLFEQGANGTNLIQEYYNILHNNYNNLQRSVVNIFQSKSLDRGITASVFGDSVIDNKKSTQLRPTYMIDLTANKDLSLRFCNYNTHEKMLDGDCAVKITKFITCGKNRVVDSLLDNKIISIQKEIDQLSALNNIKNSTNNLYKILFNLYGDRWIGSVGLGNNTQQKTQIICQLYHDYYNIFIKLFFSSPNYWTRTIHMYWDINSCRIIIHPEAKTFQWYFVNLLNKFFTTEFLNNTLSILIAQSDKITIGIMLEVLFAPLVIRIYIIIFGVDVIEYKIALVHMGNNSNKTRIVHKPLAQKKLPLNWQNYKVIKRHRGN